MVAEHIHYPYIGKGYSYQVWSLGHYGAYKQTSIGTSFDSEFFLGSIFVIYQVLTSTNEVVKYILFLELGARIMPFLTIFATTTDVGYCEYATIVHPYSIGNGKPWGVADIESAISIESSRSCTI